MSNTLDLKKGLDIPLKGAAACEVTAKVLPETVAVKPTDFPGLLPRLLVKEGDRVLAGSSPASQRRRAYSRKCASAPTPSIYS